MTFIIDAGGAEDAEGGEEWGMGKESEMSGGSEGLRAESEKNGD